MKMLCVSLFLTLSIMSIVIISWVVLYPRELLEALIFKGAHNKEAVFMGMIVWAYIIGFVYLLWHF